MAASPSPDQRLAGARRRIVHLAGLAARTHATEQNILGAATDRLASVQADLVTLRGRAVLDPAASARYQSLTLERGQLETVIARAKQAVEA